MLMVALTGRGASRSTPPPMVMPEVSCVNLSTIPRRLSASVLLLSLTMTMWIKDQRCGALCFKLKQFDPATGSICCLAGSQSNQESSIVCFAI